MADIVKRQDEDVTQELIHSLVGKFIYVPTNIHIVNNELENKREQVNAWFGGQVAGYEIATIYYDYINDSFLEEPQTHFNILLTDGVGYILSNVSEIQVLTEEEFMKMVEEYNQKNLLEVVEKNPEILIPGKDF